MMSRWPPLCAARLLGLHFLGRISLGTQYAREVDAKAKPDKDLGNNKAIYILRPRGDGAADERDNRSAHHDEFASLERIRGGGDDRSEDRLHE